MTNDKGLHRRDFIIGAGLMLTGMLCQPVHAKGGVLTPQQTEGPFFPTGGILESDADMTRITGRKVRAKGQEVLVTGRVIDLDGKPLSNTSVEVWQACDSGRYQHPVDPNTTAVLDPNFQYYCALKTDKEGRYRFRTIKPGAYPASRSWMRPPHIHLKVRRPGHTVLTTQMYFEGDPLNKKDGILQSISAPQRELVVVAFQPVEGVSTGRFDIILGPSGRHSSLLTPELD
jgi:protocatechuate 3,4-dioxygenase beta subunit